MRQHVLAAVSLCVGLAACAKERDPIDRTQPNGLEKAFFVGADLTSTADDPEFWAQATLVDVGYGASQDGLFSSTYAQPVVRLKWVVQEDLLVGRLTYERIDGADGKGAGPTSVDGQIAYAYPIVSHFDRRRAYNPITGEETNVVEENTSDRPWYERQFMRVDWSKNQVESAYELDTLSQLGVSGVEYENLAYYVSDPAHVDAPVFTDDYFDITQKAFASPKTIDLAELGLGRGEIPACYLSADFSGGTEPVGSCNPTELTIRVAFRKVVDSDYEPMEWDGLRFQAFGAFTTERKGYSREYGLSDDKWRRFIARYNIWTESYAYADRAARTGAVACYTPATTPPGADPHRDANDDGTEDECAAVGQGSRCDTLSQKCTVPFRQRGTRPIVWYYTAGSMPEYFAATADAAQQWDVAMRSAVMTARYAECMKVEKSAALCSQASPMYFGQQDHNDDALALAREVDDCRYGRAYANEDCGVLAQRLGAERGYDPAVIHLAQQPEMVVLCHSPVEVSDPAVCGAAGTLVRRGDLRFHQVNVFEAPQVPSPWGIYTDAHDPLSGETIAASINVWAFRTDLFAQSVVDKVRYIAGELSTEQITEGADVHAWGEASEKAAGGGILPGLTRAELDQRLASFAGSSVEAMQARRAEVLAEPRLADKIQRLNRELGETRADAQRPASAAAVYEARRARAEGTALEAALDTQPMRQLAGVQSLPAQAGITYSSPLRGNNPGLWRALAQQREAALGARGACIKHEGPSPTSLSGLTDILQEKFGRLSADSPLGEQLARAAQMRRYVADRAHFSVILHEMGHSIGMRHNFVSSSDAMSYRPQYWQLRTKNGAVSQECTDLVRDGSSCVGPRWFDPVTEDERKQLLTMFMHSSTMEYAGEYTQDMLGLGAYDFAAARMFYGDALAVHADPSYAVGQARGRAVLGKADNFGGILGFSWSKNGDEARNGIHYSQLQKNFDLIKDCKVVDPAKYRPATWDEAKLGVWHPVLDGQLVQVDGAWTRCAQQPVDYVVWSKLRPATNEEAGGFSRGGNTIDAGGRTRVPYGFATDRWADLGNLAVYRHDNGADAYELFDFLISEQEVNHIFDNYRRGRTAFSVRGAVSRTLARYNEKLRDGAKGLGLFVNIYRDFALAQGYDFNSLWPAIVGSRPGEYNALSTNVLAAGIAFDHFTRMMGRPEAGEHYLGVDQVLRSSTDAAGNPGETALRVANGVSGGFGDVAVGGRPVANTFADGKGEYDNEYTMNVGSYYEKAYSSMLLTESVDNFVSDSRRDFVDSRYRAVSMADLFPEGYRRWLSSNLTGDDKLKGAWVRAEGGRPMTSADQWSSGPIGWTSWWTAAPQVCLQNAGAMSCATYSDSSMGAGTDREVLAIDPQVGWEQQKFLVAWTLMYLPENDQRTWLDMMGMWNLGEDSDPGFANRVELHDPSGVVYVAKTFGKESVFGKSVQRGIAARVLEYGNQLLDAAYVTDAGPDRDGDGRPDWLLPRLGADGQPTVKWDPSVAWLNASGGVSTRGRVGCNSVSSAECRCEDNRACVELSRYMALPAFFRTALRDLGLADASMKGLY